ncbi:hypothetical protein B0H11DRAFT_1934586 [Mycena galericulata]|nr:hypothetical protein B0H11DRAFT_1934586 [Mycena galericulata]
MPSSLNIDTPADAPVISNQPARVLFTTFTAGGTPASQPNARAKAQARYRAKNRQREQNKSRERMSRLREARRGGGEEELQRKASSEKLRATQHAQEHIVPFLIEQERKGEPEGAGEPHGAEGPVVEAIKRDLLPDEVVACRGNFRLVFSITNARTVASFDKMLAAGEDLDDDDLEFMIRHQVPAPTLENLACCVHHSTSRAIAVAKEAHQLRISGEPFVAWVLDRARATAGNPRLRLRSGAQYFSPAFEIYVRARRKMLVIRFRVERQGKLGVGYRNQKKLEAERRACVARARPGGGNGKSFMVFEFLVLAELSFKAKIYSAWVATQQGLRDGHGFGLRKPEIVGVGHDGRTRGYAGGRRQGGGAQDSQSLTLWALRELLGGQNVGVAVDPHAFEGLLGYFQAPWKAYPILGVDVDKKFIQRGGAGREYSDKRFDMIAFWEGLLTSFRSRCRIRGARGRFKEEGSKRQAQRGMLKEAGKWGGVVKKNYQPGSGCSLRNADGEREREQEVMMKAEGEVKGWSQYSYNYSTPPSTAPNGAASSSSAAPAPPSSAPAAATTTPDGFPLTPAPGTDGRATCPMPFHPDPGHTAQGIHDSSTDKFYVASPARQPGTYTNSERATSVCKGFRNGHMQGCNTWGEALDQWARMCRQFHGEHCPDAQRRVTMETRIFLREQRVRGEYWGVKGIYEVFETRSCSAGAFTAADAQDLKDIHIIASRDLLTVMEFTKS